MSQRKGNDGGVHKSGGSGEKRGSSLPPTYSNPPMPPVKQPAKPPEKK